MESSPSASIQDGLISQMLACLFMLRNCMATCPDKDWNERHGDYPFSQVMFHTLFYCDFYLCDTAEDFKLQVFHLQHTATFADYEELEDRLPRSLYDRGFINLYYEHCRAKVETVLRSKSLEDLIEPLSDVRKNMTRFERYVDLIRHLQHHAAQLGLRLQFVTGKEMDWISRGF